MKLISNVVKNESLKVYDFTVDDVHHYVLDNDIITHNSYGDPKTMSGGGGLKFAGSQIAMLSKRKHKDGKEVIGNQIVVKMKKSRLSKENTESVVLLTYKHGLDRHFGLLELAEKYNIFKKVSTRFELPDGTKVFGKSIITNPEKYFTEDIMKQLEECARKEYYYGEPEDDLNEMFHDEEDQEDEIVEAEAVPEEV